MKPELGQRFDADLLQFRLVCRCEPNNYWIAALILLVVLPAGAQEALQNSLARGKAPLPRDTQMQSLDYTLKYGDFQMSISPSQGFQWNDNVNLSKTNSMDDYIVSPAVGIKASYPLSKRNLLSLDVNVGYDRYLLHPKLSTFNLNASTKTGLSFDMVIKPLTINLHDWISYVQDSAMNPTVANTGNFGTFQNTVGISGTWDLNQVTLSLGYDHENILATSGQFNQIDHQSQMLFVRAGLQVHPKVTVGLESTASFTDYDQNNGAGLNNNDAYTIGPYITFQADSSFTVTARGGFTAYQFQNSSTNIQTSDQNTWYAAVTIRHQPRASIGYALDAGHEVTLGIQSDLVEDSYVRPNIDWEIINGVNFNTSLFYEHGESGVGSTGSLPGTSSGSFDWYGGTLTVRHELTKRLNLGLNYRLTFRSSGTSKDSYAQNLVGLQLIYYFK
jgi:hypothetical protein